MDAKSARKLRQLKSDFEKVEGRTFRHFFCPILFKDEDTPLCKAHIVNAAFKGLPKHWTIQRKDVDGFYGAFFESEFLDIRHRGRRADEVIADKSLSSRFKPKIVVDGTPVQYYSPGRKLPRHHSLVAIEGSFGSVRLALKVRPSQMKKLAKAKWQLGFEKDLRVPALVSFLKMAHLTLFDLLGYEYALSAGGHFLGRVILGDFYVANSGGSRQDVLASATPHFRRFAGMWRPMPESPANKTLKGTIQDGQVFLCMQGDIIWGIVVLVRTPFSLNGVLAPIFDVVEGAVRFLNILEGPEERIVARQARFERDHWDVSTEESVLIWPKTGVLYPE